MAYDYSSENKNLELPNPYRVENLFLFFCAVALLLAGVVALFWAQSALQVREGSRGMVPIIVGMGLLMSGLSFAAFGARRLRFYFGRGRPSSLAPEVAIGGVGNSNAADYFKNMMRQGGIPYPEPKGALNGLLYHTIPRLITAPRVVQELVQKHFSTAVTFVVTFLSFAISWGLFGTEQTRPVIGIAYFLFAAFVLLRPLYRGDRAPPISPWLMVLLIVAAVLGPALVGTLGSTLPRVTLSLDGQTFLMLFAAMIAVSLILLALLSQVDAPPHTERSCEQISLSMNGPPGALLTELDRRLQSEWTQNIPNRRYTRIEPKTSGAMGSGNFTGEMFEESQPMPMPGAAAPTIAGAMVAPRHRWLMALDFYATVLVLAAVWFAMTYLRGDETFSSLNSASDQGRALGYSIIFLVVSVFCFRSAARIWGRFDFESTLVWIELQGVWQSSRIGTGNQMTSQMHTENDVVRVEQMTLRVWRARIESVVFGKDSERQVAAMFATAQEARRMVADLSAFASHQSVFIAPQASEDIRRLDALKATEKLLTGSVAGAPGGLAQIAAAEALRVASAGTDTAGFCTGCGTKVVAAAKFCGNCGQPAAAGR